MADKKQKTGDITKTFEYKLGLDVGVKAACQIILDKLNNKSKSIPYRIADVKRFCNDPFREKKKIEDKQ